jgi:RNA polymerase sigma factor (TIGR02999 family)
LTSAAALRYQHCGEPADGQTLAMVGSVPDVAQEQRTTLLIRWRGGDAAALAASIPVVYRELRAVAARYLSGKREGHTLQSTALVHEAYLRLIAQSLPEWRNRAHFFAVAAQIMRQILVDHARNRQADKRGGGMPNIALEAKVEGPLRIDVNLVAPDDALTALGRIDPQQSRVVELKFFAGHSNEDTSAVLGISTSTVKRDWTVARAWLYRELAGSAP